MSFIGDIFSSNKGAGFQAQSAPIDRPLSPQEAQAQIDHANASQLQMQGFLASLQGQNGIGNQTNALAQQQALANQLAANNGAANEASTFARQGQTADQLQSISEGKGPNPAQTMLNTATGNNVANTAALMAGQRGANANAGLIARQAGLQGANAAQQAAGQAATLQANQSLGALGQLQSQEQAMQAAAANQVGQQASQQANIANLTSQQVAQQAGAQNAATSAQQAQESNLLNQVNAQNNAGITMQSNINNANAGIAGINAQNQGNILSKTAGGAGSLLGLAKGGEVPAVKMADGGSITPVSGPQSNVGQYLATSRVDAGAANPGGGPSIPRIDDIWKNMGSQKKPGVPPTVADPFADSRIPTQAMAGGFGDALGAAADVAPMIANKGGMASKRPIVGETMAAQGKLVPGQAKVKGDSLKNDTVPAVLSPGEVIIPRSVMQSKDPAKEAAKFVMAVMAKNGKGLKRG